MGGTNKRSLRLEGEKIYLRPVGVEDATENYVSWLNDPSTTKFLESGGRSETPESLRDYILRFEGRKDTLFLAVVLKEGAVHVGNIKLEPIQFEHKKAELGIMIGASEARGRGIGGEAIGLILDYAFEELGLNRVSLGVRSDNLPAIRCYEKIGFKKEGVFREAIWNGDRFIDSLSMSILASEFERET